MHLIIKIKTQDERKSLILSNLDLSKLNLSK